MATVNTNDAKLKSYENTKNQMLNEVQTNYNTMVGQTNQKYNELINASKNYTNQQTQIQQQKTDQTIAEINQNKDKVTNDYIKQQKAAYSDYAKQTNDYGVQAEQQAAAGLQNSGYSESTKVNLFNTYQNRVVAAKESFDQAILAYDNQITQAQIANSSVLAEIAYNGLTKQSELALENLRYNNELLNNLTQQKLNISSQYDNLWQSQYKTLLDEAQYNEDMAFKKSEAARDQANWEKTYALQKQQAAAKSSGSSSKSSSSKSSGGSSGTTLTNTSNQSKISDTANKLLTAVKNMTSSKIGLVNMTQKAAARGAIYNQVQSGKITETEASYIFDKAGL